MCREGVRVEKECEERGVRVEKECEKRRSVGREKESREGVRVDKERVEKDYE